MCHLRTCSGGKWYVSMSDGCVQFAPGASGPFQSCHMVHLTEFNPLCLPHERVGPSTSAWIMEISEQFQNVDER